MCVTGWLVDSESISGYRQKKPPLFTKLRKPRGFSFGRFSEAQIVIEYSQFWPKFFAFSRLARLRRAFIFNF